MGGLYGLRLLAGGHHVSFLLRGDFQEVREKGEQAERTPALPPSPGRVLGGAECGDWGGGAGTGGAADACSSMQCTNPTAPMAVLLQYIYWMFTCRSMHVACPRYRLP